MSQSSDPPKSTTFLLLKATGQTPTITNTSSVAGDAFNRTLRQIASLPQFHSQLFGWRDNAVPSQLVPTAGTDVMKEGELVWDPQYFGWRKPQGSGNETELRVGGDVLVWVISMFPCADNLTGFEFETNWADRLGISTNVNTYCGTYRSAQGYSPSLRAASHRSRRPQSNIVFPGIFCPMGRGRTKANSEQNHSTGGAYRIEQMLGWVRSTYPIRIRGR